ncbi:uncharacterized protein BCR38DRAFT_415792 [Pseudomassariella vexata]|uniref:Uncharacterized protein n=1 Tax=Pseudomassariella vexata TaxID=1141098 RepID=A0A1Y2EHL0_9PEZI|nr:uncharacterized protein BCR38DRAFT_415792 [Pseudomassariella vexata]ORY71049.1 hypothetical protein BCR38DRAFT_415792 [Pseudomassariella vexata]
MTRRQRSCPRVTVGQHIADEKCAYKAAPCQINHIGRDIDAGYIEADVGYHLCDRDPGAATGVEDVGAGRGFGDGFLYAYGFEGVGAHMCIVLRIVRLVLVGWNQVVLVATHEPPMTVGFLAVGMLVFYFETLEGLEVGRRAWYRMLRAIWRK